VPGGGGAYANLSEFVRAGMRHLMERDRARAFHVLKAEIDEAIDQAEAGDNEEFDPVAYAPDSFR
jgi:antitoxin ParD1/3/4